MRKSLALLGVALAVALAACGQQMKASDPQKIITITISHDWLDYLSGVSAVALAIIGCFGVCYAKRTLANIERQANLMKEQSDLTVSQNRARLHHSLSSGNLEIDSRFDPLQSLDGKELGQIAIYVRNHGKSKAFNVSVQAAIILGDAKYPPMSQAIPLLVNEVIDENETREVEGAGYSLMEITDKQKDLIRNGEKVLHFFGIISYRDVFSEVSGNKPRIEAFRYVAKPQVHFIDVATEDITTEECVVTWDWEPVASVGESAGYQDQRQNSN